MKTNFMAILVAAFLFTGLILTGCAQQSQLSAPEQTGQIPQAPAADTSGQQIQPGPTQAGEQVNQTQPPQNQTNQSTNQPQVQAPPPPTAAKTYDVTIQGFAFSPFALKINKGDTVVWTNKDSVPHTVVSDSGSEISSPSLSTDQTYSHTFSQAGTFNYHCGIHQTMKARVEVT